MENNKSCRNNVQFRYTSAERAAIVATLPTQNEQQCSSAIIQLEQAAQEFRADRARRLEEPPIEQREKLRRLLTAIGKTKRLALDAGEPGIEAQLDETQASRGITFNAYKRLTRAFRGGADLDSEILYFRVLSIWVELGGIVNTSYVRTALARFLIAVVTPVLGAKAPKAAAIKAIVKRYLKIRERGWLGTVKEFKADQPFIADVDHFIVVDDRGVEDSSK